MSDIQLCRYPIPPDAKIWSMKEIFTEDLMPDENKFAKLNEIGYIIPPCCILCTHGTFVGAARWGTCDKHTYEHKKHTGDERQMSINISGHCDDFRTNDEKLCRLMSFQRFFKDPEPQRKNDG